MKIFIHIDHFSTYVGNGGFIVLTNLANELGKMGYDVYLFDPRDKLNYKMLDWLSLPEVNFKITKTKDVLTSNPNDYRLITAWLRTLPYQFRNENLRYLESSELIRKARMAEIGYLLKYNIKVANLHSHLNHYYINIGLKNIIALDVWIRSDVKFRGERFKINNCIGIQLEARRDKIARLLSKVGIKLYKWDRYTRFRRMPIIICNGKYREVIDKMNRSDFFIHNPQPSPHITIFKGETFGLPLFEAMACGCICIARKHEGIKFLEGKIPLVKNMDEALEMLNYLMSNKEEKEEIRTRSISFIEENYRFNEERKKAIERWLE